MFTAFRTKLRALGYEEGREVTLEFHFAKGSERLTALAKAIASEGVDVVLADGRSAAQAMQAASRTIPIVAITGEPVAGGLAESLARPGGNVTGVSALVAELGPKAARVHARDPSLGATHRCGRRVDVSGSGL